MNNKTIDTEKGHWILAKMGKRVLRPGGRELTLKLVEALNIRARDEVVEFAPGMGYTARFILKQKPFSYTGIELNEEAATILKTKLPASPCTIINSSAAHTGLQDAATDIVVAEAMLTMQADHRKSEIIKEAYRILKKGGRYGIHELGLQPNGLDPEIKSGIQRELAQTIKVNARPLTLVDWCTLLKDEGFKIIETHTAPMHLLEPDRMIRDEGILRTLKIGFNILTHPKARHRILKMRNIFKKYDRQMTAFAIIAEKE